LLAAGTLDEAGFKNWVRASITGQVKLSNLQDR
jgi:hypothetical protein